MKWFFTGKGDDGKTTIKGGQRIYKNEPVFRLIGTLDELTAYLGLSISYSSDENIRGDLNELQIKLSDLMGVIANSDVDQYAVNPELEGLVGWIEEKIIAYGEGVEAPRTFVFSGKNSLGAGLDVCRTVARRAEREAVALFRESSRFDRKILVVLNRLSTLLFLMRLSAEQN